MDNKKKIRDRKLKKEKDFYEGAHEADKKESLISKLKDPNKNLDKALAYKPSKGRSPASESEDEGTEVRKKVLGRIAKGDAKSYFQNAKRLGDDNATEVMSKKSDEYTKKQIDDYTKEELYKKRMGKKK